MRLPATPPRVHARRRALLCSAAWLCAPLRAPAQDSRAAPGARTYRVIDLMPAFWRYWSGAQRLPAERHAALLRQTLFVAHPEVYNAGVLGLDAAKPLADELERRYARWLPRLQPHIERMRRVSERIATDLPRYEASFRDAFPDLAYDGEVYFLSSLGAFDGATRTVKGRTALLFGVDMIAAIYGDAVDPQAFFHHELFHVYHAQVAPASEDRLIDGLWSEGLALHVAKTLNPAADGVALFGLPPDMPERAQRMLPRLAREMREQLDSTSSEVYARYFLGNHLDGAIAPRSGYYVGYQVARRIGADLKLAALARLQGPALRMVVERALRDLEATN